MRSAAPQRARPAATAPAGADLRRFTENLPDIAYRYRVSPSLRFEYISSAVATLTGYSPEDHYADPDLALKQVHPADLPILLAIVRSPRAAHPIVVRWIRRDGSIVWVEMRHAPVRDERGDVVAVEGIARDVTAQRERDQELRRWAEEVFERNRRLGDEVRTKSRFLSDLAHEIRTPLAAIQGFAELMVGGKLGPLAERHRQLLERIAAGAEHLLAVVAISLDMATIESGRMRLERECVDPCALAREVGAIVDGLAQRHDITIDFDLERWTGPVAIDASRFKQILYNFLSNAVKFTHDGGRAVVRIAPEDPEHVRVEVEDDGIGVRPEDVPRLFREFQQIDATSAHRGSGLGLALTKRIVEAMGGWVGVDTAPGRGSRFFAILPRR